MEGSLSSVVANGSLEMVKKLLSQGADIDVPGQDGTTPLCAAALWGNVEMVKYLVNNGANINAKNKGSGWTALHAAAFQEHGKVVHFLINKGSDMFIRDIEGRSPIDFASISVAVWPFFACKGAQKTSKSSLVEKGIVRKLAKGENRRPESRIKDLSQRPGSAYVRTNINPFNVYQGLQKGIHRKTLQSRSQNRDDDFRNKTKGPDILSLDRNDDMDMDDSDDQPDLGGIF